MTATIRATLALSVAVAMATACREAARPGPPAPTTVTLLQGSTAPTPIAEVDAAVSDAGSTLDADYADGRYEIIQHPKLDLQPDVAPFLKAGCDDRLACKKARENVLKGCMRTGRAWDLGGLTPKTSMISCDLHDENRGIVTVGMLSPYSTAFVIHTGTRFELLDSGEAFVKRFAPVDSPEEALGFAIALTNDVARFELTMQPRYRVRARRIETTYATATPEGFVVHLFRRPGAGRGPKPWLAIDYRVTANGDVTELARAPMFENPDDDEFREF